MRGFQITVMVSAPVCVSCGLSILIFLGSCLVSGVRDKISAAGSESWHTEPRAMVGPVWRAQGSNCKHFTRLSLLSTAAGQISRAERGEGGGHSTCGTSNSPLRVNYKDDILDTVLS